MSSLMYDTVAIRKTIRKLKDDIAKHLRNNAKLTDQIEALKKVNRGYVIRESQYHDTLKERDKQIAEKDDVIREWREGCEIHKRVIAEKDKRIDEMAKTLDFLLPELCKHCFQTYYDFVNDEKEATDD